MSDPKYTELCWDFKSRPELEELQEALEPLGVFVFEDPYTEGSDSLGYIFSNENLTEEELEEIGERYE